MNPKILNVTAVTSIYDGIESFFKEKFSNELYVIMNADSDI